MERFDGRNLTSRLGHATRDEIVRTSVELVVAWRGQDAAGDRLAALRPYEAAAVNLMRRLEDKVSQVLPPEVAQADLPPVPAAAGRVCRVCFCSEHGSWAPTDGWAAAELCARCAGAADDGCNSTGSGPEPIGPREDDHG